MNQDEQRSILVQPNDFLFDLKNGCYQSSFISLWTFSTLFALLTILLFWIHPKSICKREKMWERKPNRNDCQDISSRKAPWTSNADSCMSIIEFILCSLVAKRRRCNNQSSGKVFLIVRQIKPFDFKCLTFSPDNETYWTICVCLLRSFKSERVWNRWWERELKSDDF